jgi:hypothetical protein
VNIFLNIINKLGRKIVTQHVYCKLRTAFLNTQFIFRVQKGQLKKYRVIFVLVSPTVHNNSAVPAKHTKTLHTRTHSLIHSIDHYNADSFPVQTDHLYVAHLMPFISISGCAAPCDRMVSE